MERDTDFLNFFEAETRKTFDFLETEKGFSVLIDDMWDDPRSYSFTVKYEHPTTKVLFGISVFYDNCSFEIAVYIPLKDSTYRNYVNVEEVISKLNIDIDRNSFPIIHNKMHKSNFKQYKERLSVEYPHYIRKYADALKRNYELIMKEAEIISISNKNVLEPKSSKLSSVLIILIVFFRIMGWIK